MLKIISWNVRGLEGQTKRRFVKEVLCQEDPNIVILMETERKEFCNKRVANIWKRRRVEWEVLAVEDLSGCILMLWNSRLEEDILCLWLSWMVIVKSSGLLGFMAV